MTTPQPDPSPKVTEAKATLQRCVDALVEQVVTVGRAKARHADALEANSSDIFTYAQNMRRAEARAKELLDAANTAAGSLYGIIESPEVST